jgi:two-component system chemotaxis response regulator CheB
MTSAASSTPVPIIVVDDSPVQRRFLRAAIEAGTEAGTEFTVVGEARNGKEAVALVARLRPAAILMDLDLPVMSGIEAIELIMAVSPTPILVYSAHVGGQESTRALEALAAGAVDVLAKPGPHDTGSLDQYADEIRKKLRVASRIRVITHPRGKLRTREAAHATPRLGLTRTTPITDEVAARVGVKLIAVGASTGGPQALHTLLRALPSDLEQAVLVVQHMAEGFIAGLASWLDQLVPMPVIVGGSGRRLQPGTITIAPSGHNLLVQDDRLRVSCVDPQPGQFHVPGIDQCFTSVADSLGPDAVGILLTGMGRDGAQGLKAMRARGATTLGQDEATSTVYGMPQAAFALDAVDRQLALDDIAPAVLGLVGRS